MDDVDKELTGFHQDLSAVAVEMLPEKKLSLYFTSPPPEKSLHIIVEHPGFVKELSCHTKRSHGEYKENGKLRLLPKRPRTPSEAYILHMVLNCL